MMEAIALEVVMVTSKDRTMEQFKPSVYLFHTKDSADSFAYDLEAKFEVCGCNDVFRVSRDSAEVLE